MSQPPAGSNKHAPPLEPGPGSFGPGSSGTGRDAVARCIALLSGPVAALLLLWLLPTQFTDASGQNTDFSWAGRATLAMLAWMAIWWLTEAIDLTATALLPLVAFPLLSISDMKTAAAPFADPLIFLFLGGFLLSISMQRWQLDQRIALITLRYVGTRPSHMVAGFMLVTAVLSAFVSNTATAAAMLPIALSVIAFGKRPALDGAPPTNLDQPQSPAVGATPRDTIPETPRPDDANFATCLMLGIAYAASIGGLATIVGTPPNVFLVGFLRDKIALPYRCEVTFVAWLAIGLPLVLILLPLVWWMLTAWLYPLSARPIQGGTTMIGQAYRKLGPLQTGETVTLLVFAITVALWLTRPWFTAWQWGEQQNPWRPFAAVTDSVIAMAAALSLFVIPIRLSPAKFVLQWSATQDLPWGILLLFGGGLSLAESVNTHGVAEFIGSHVHLIAGLPSLLIVLIVCIAVVFLTELTSNIATTAALIPILAALAPALGLHPFLLVIPATIAASCAFMLPVATPPNAIVFASGEVTIAQMARAGFWLNLFSIAIITAITFAVVQPWIQWITRS